jgi:hypothetical protein
MVLRSIRATGTSSQARQRPLDRWLEDLVDVVRRNRAYQLVCDLASLGLIFLQELMTFRRSARRLAQKYSPGGERRPAKGCREGSAHATRAVLEIAVRWRVRRIGADEPVPVARHVRARGRSRLMSH